MHGHDHTPQVSYRGSSGLQLHSIPVIVDALRTSSEYPFLRESAKVGLYFGQFCSLIQSIL